LLFAIVGGFQHIHKGGLVEVNTSLSTNIITKRAKAVGLPEELVSEFLSNVFKWIRCSGPEWTISRLKSTRVDLVKWYSDGVKPETEWVARNSQGQFSGLFGKLQRISSSSPKNFRRVQTLFSVYTAYVAEKVTPQQRDKFFNSVEAPAHPNSDGLVTAGRSLASSLSDFKGGLAPLPGPAGPILLSSRKKQSHEDRIIKEILWYFGHKEGMQLALDNVESVYTPLSKTFSWRINPRLDGVPPVGSVQVTQERGYKGRFYAAPMIWVQHLLDPLKDYLGHIVRDLPWDCTFDQLKADVQIQQALTQRRTLSCFDLSDATNNFPWQLQAGLLLGLQELGGGPSWSWAKLMNHFVDSPWTTSHLDVGQDEVVWSKGQPLGIGPSFFLFTLAHGLLLLSLNGGKHEDKFFVLGDDVIILDIDLAKRYVETMDELNVPISAHKSTLSENIAEFAGYLYDRKGKYLKPKWKGHRDDNLLDIVRDNGPEYLPLVPRQVRLFVEYISQLPQPLGFGWNPRGRPLSERLLGVEELWWNPEDPDLKYDLDPRSRIRQRAISISGTSRLAATRILNISMEPNIVDQLEQSYDQSIKEHLGSKMVPLRDVLGGNLFHIAPDLDIPLEKPLKWKSGKHSPLKDMKRRLRSHLQRSYS
jgi:hypothetical protein